MLSAIGKGAFYRVLSALLLLCCSAVVPAALATAKPTERVLLVIPDGTYVPFWGNVNAFAEAVAEDLGYEILLHVIPPAENNRFRFAKSVFERIDSLPEQARPVLVISFIVKDAEGPLLSGLNERKLDTITFNAPLEPALVRSIGWPREQYRHWLGHVAPDDIETGAALVRILLAAWTDTRPAKMLAFAGDRTNRPSSRRVVGMETEALRSGMIELQQLVYTNWHKEDGLAKSQILFRRHADTNFVWGASDFIVAGVIEMLEGMDVEPGKDLLVGGIDWNEENLDLIAEGKQFVSLGGHLVEAGLALIYFHNYRCGHDFADDIGIQKKTQPIPITQQNVKAYRSKLRQETWPDIDFRRFDYCGKAEADLPSLSPKTLLDLP